MPPRVDPHIPHLYDGRGLVMTRLVLVAGLVGLAAAPAYADGAYPDNVPGISNTAPGLTPEGVLAPISIVEGAGVKIGEGTVLHPIVGFETGYVSNVFYNASNENPAGAAILRLVAQIGTGSLSAQRLAPTSPEDLSEPQNQNPGSFTYRADLRASYDFYLSGNDAVTSQDGLGLGAVLRGVVLPQRTWSLLYLEDFERLIRPTNFESNQQLNRDVNHVQLGLQFAPRDLSLSGLLHYENIIDLFESDGSRFANRIENSLGVTASWRFRPLTVLFADITESYNTGLDADSRKVNSYPLIATTGIQTLLTLNTTFVARVGYTNGFYSAGPSYSAVVGGVQLGYRYAETGRVTAMYDYNHQDSINANYYRDHDIRLLLEQQFVPFVLTVQPEVRLRHYDGVQMVEGTGPNTRDDVIFTVSVGARYNFRDWFAAVVQYQLSDDQTDYRDPMGDNPSFVRHELVAGVRAAL